MTVRYRARHPWQEESRPRVWLTTSEFDLLDRAAKAEGITYSEFIERIVRAWCVEREALDTAAREPIDPTAAVNRYLSEMGR